MYIPLEYVKLVSYLLMEDLIMRKLLQLGSIVGLFYGISEFGGGSFYIDSVNSLFLLGSVIFIIMYVVERLMHKIVYLTELLIDSNMVVLGVGMLSEAIIFSIVMYLFSVNCWNVSISGIFTYIVVSVLLVAIQYICLDENPYRVLDESV